MQMVVNRGFRPIRVIHKNLLTFLSLENQSCKANPLEQRVKYNNLPKDVLWVFEIAAQSRKKDIILHYKTKAY